MYQYERGACAQLVWKQWLVVITVQKVWDAPIESCERELGNIHNTFAV